MPDLLIGVDVGTSSTKAAIFDSTGVQLVRACVPTPLTWEGRDRCYVDPDDFYSATITSIHACVSQASISSADVKAIAVAGQMAGVMGIDAAYRPSTPYDSWLDTRCSEDVAFLEETLGDHLTARTGCPPMVNHAPKMRWRKRERPDEYRQTAKFVMPAAYVAGRMTGLSSDQAFIDRTYLHFTGVADVASVSWSEELIEAVGLDRQKLPEILNPADTLGTLTIEAAEATGLGRHVVVAAGLGDTAAGALGAGIVRDNQILDLAGTAAVLAASGSTFEPDTKERTLLVMRGAIDDQWISLAYLSGGDLLSWFGSSIARLEVAIDDGEGSARTADLLKVPRHDLDVLFLPFLDGRILPSNPSTRGAWLGLKRSHTWQDLLQAVMESVPFEYSGYLRILHQLHPGLTPVDVRVAGGGGKSRVWNQIKASALHLPYKSLDREELGCWGAALVAGRAVGIFDDLASAASRTTRVTDIIQPDPCLSERYESLIPIYRESLAALKGTFDKLSWLNPSVGVETDG